MQNSERLQELYNASLNSNGAANEQYGKTLESLETKLTKLRNAWNEFTTGLLNNDVIKFGIDLLTLLLNVLNKVTSFMESSVANTVVKITIIITLFTLAKAALKGLTVEWINFYNSVKKKDIVGPVKQKVGGAVNSAKGFGATFTGEMSQFFTKLGASLKTAVSLLTSPGGLIVAGIAAAAVIGYLIYRFTSLNEKIKDAEKAAQEANKAYNNLSSSLSELKDSLADVATQTNALENLTRGTDEWREAQEKLNKSVDELIEKYPKLLGFVEMDKYGTKTIDTDSESVKSIIKNYEDRTVQAKAASLGAENYLSELRIQKAENEYDYDTKKAQQQKITNNQRSLAKNSLSMLDGTDYSEKVYDQMATMASQQLAENMTEAAKKIYESGTYNQKVADREAMAEAIYGAGATVGGFGNNTITYYDEEGQKKTVTLRKEEWAAQVAAYKATNNMTKALEQIPSVVDKMAAGLSKISTKAEKALRNIFTKGSDVGELTAKDYEDLKSANINIEDLISADAPEELKESIKETFNEIFENLKLAAEQVREKSENYGLEKGALDNVETDAANAWLDKLENLGRMGGNRIDEVEKAMEKVTAGMNSEDLSNFLNAVSSTDWTRTGLNGLNDSFEALKVSIPTAKLNEFKNSLLGAVAATKQYSDLTQTQISTLAKEGTRKFIVESNGLISEELYKTLVAADSTLEDDFVKTLDGQYAYVGRLDKLVEITDDIREKISFSANSNNATQYNAIRAAQDVLNQTIKTRSGEKSYGSWQDVTYREGLVDIAKVVQTTLNKYLKTDEDVPKPLSDAGYSVTTTNFDDETFWTEEKLTSFLEAVENESLGETLLEKWKEAKAISGLSEEATDNITRFYSANGGLSPEWDELDERQQAVIETEKDILVTKARVMGITEEEIKTYETLFDAYSRGKNVYKQMLSAQVGLANKINYDEMREGLQGQLKDMNAIAEEYDKLAKGDVKGKRNALDNIAQTLGIKLNHNGNEKYLDALKEMIQQTSMGNEEAYYNLVMEIAKSVEKDAFGDIKSIEEMMDIISRDGISAHQELIKKLTDNNLGVISNQSVGGKIFQTFSLSSEALLQSVANLAGNLDKLWESPYTWLDNYSERVQSLLRQYEKLERKYDKLVEKEEDSPQDLINTSRSELSSLNERALTYKYGAANAQNEIRNLINSNSEFAKYISYDAKRNEVLVDWENVKKTGWDDETGSKFDELVSQVKENRDTYNEAVDGLEDIEDTVEEIKNRGRDEYSDLLDAVKEGWVDERQEEIDKLQEINDSIEEAQSKLLSSMREQLEETRQRRDNEKAEKSIEDKRLRLAYLQRDTSGANAVEIAALQKEIGKDEESYTDSLIDQRLDSIEKANEKAAQQRQEQINIQNDQLKAFVDSGEIWNHIKAVVDNDLEAYTKGSTPWQQTQSAFYSLWGKSKTENPIEYALSKDENLQAAKKAAEYVNKQDGTSSLSDDISGLKDAIKTYQEEVEKLAKSVGNHGIELSFDGDILGTKLTDLIKATVKTDSLKTEEEVKTELAPSSSGSIISPKKEGFTDMLYDPSSSYNTENSSEKTPEFHKPSLPTITDEGVSKTTIKGNGELASGNKDNTTSDKAITISDEPPDTSVYENTVVGKNGSYISIGTPDGITYTASLASGKNILTTFSSVYEPDDNLMDIKSYLPRDSKFFKKITDKKQLRTLEKYTGFIGEGEIGTLTQESNGKKYLGYITKAGSDWYKINVAEFDKAYDGAVDSFFPSYNNLRKNGYNLWQYKSGGLADFTGPAWLDGTKSSPELVLNAQDTQNFIALKDILASILNNNTPFDTKKSNGGDNYYDINIEVDEVASDYDVDQIADRIKEIIYEDATYRNVSIINSVK